LKIFFDKDGNERPPYKWELKELGFSPQQIKEILLPYSDGRIYLNNLLAFTTFIGFVIAGSLYMLTALACCYNGFNLAEDRIWLIRIIAVVFLSLLPSVSLVLGSYLQNIVSKLLLVIAVLIGLFWGGAGLWFTILHPNWGWILVTGVIYCVLIILSALKIRKKLSANLN